MNSITMKMQADKLIRMALQEDITSEDVSTNAVMRSAVKGTVDLIAKEDGIIAGLDVYARVFQILDEKTEISFNFKDGEAVKKGDLLGTVTGDIRAESLLASGAISKIADGVKILGNGELTKKLNVKVNAVSETAKSKIEAAGGTVEVI